MLFAGSTEPFLPMTWSAFDHVYKHVLPYEKSTYLFELPTHPIIMGKAEIEALAKRIEALEAKVGKNHSSPVLPYLVDYSNDLGNSLAGNDRIGPLLKRLDELETYLDPLFAEKEACSLGVKLSLAESEFETVKANQGMLGEQYL